MRQADLLLVRSETRVTEKLIAGSRIRFVASATSGTDHVDLAYLRSQAIVFADARGANARSVAEYVLAALLKLAQRENFFLQGKSIGVVGVGEVGSRRDKPDAATYEQLLSDFRL